jgi:hypothetical protein
VSIRADTYVVLVPQWVILLVIAIGAWFALSVGGGLLIGRILGMAERHRPQTRRRARPS